MFTPILTARRKTAEAYLPLSEACLRAEVSVCSECTEQPSLVQIAITADEAFEGVIRIALPVDHEEPRFFLPGFMYGTNRGDAPLVVDSQTPRLRAEGDFPASSWWMVRSDRLSHPCPSPMPAAGFAVLLHRPTTCARMTGAPPGPPA